MSRLFGRLCIIARALPRLALKPLRRRPVQLRRVLVAHNLLLGDTLLLTPLLAKLREQHPNAQIVLTCPKPIMPLYAGRPFGVDAIPFDPRDLSSVLGVLRSGPYDLGIVAGDNRHSWLALAANCRWIVAHNGDMPRWKNWPVNEGHSYPSTPASWADLVADLVDGPTPRRYRTSDWPSPCRGALREAEWPDRPYVVLHPGASTTVKHWPDGRWRELARSVAAWGYIPVWSGGPGEDKLIRNIGVERGEINLVGKLGLGELWYLFAGARAVVCPDTGVAHLARLVGVPAIALFGPGNALIHGAGEYWREMPFVSITDRDMPCRDQPYIFRRKVRWVRRCDRNEKTCVAWHDGHAACMAHLSVAAVGELLQRVLLAAQ